MRKFATTNCIVSKQLKLILGVLVVLIGVLAVFVGLLGVFCIGMAYLSHEMEHSELGMVYLVFS